ncbi:MAG: prepilin-type N-terminal cleavage/methylation domain-containing protein [Desulfobacteraceae bacterium]|jgi:prepilin-type N-terminal cleavage/methylation domain-containing protein|nr:prepilin-type N-terminal cleavage/methylation domain-containing protein [Desulfobacteraceae bacterium]
MQQGFTILELLVVLVIISLAAAFVGPRLLSPNSNLQLKTTVNKMAGALRYASNTATTTQKDMVGVLDIRNSRISVLPAGDFDENEFAYHGKSDREGLNAFNFPEDMIFFKDFSTIKKISPDIFMVYFFPNGSSSGGDIVFGNDKGFKYQIKIDFITSIITIDRLQ